MFLQYVIFLDQKFKDRLYSKIKEYPSLGEPIVTGRGDFRFKGVQVDDSTTVDIDISFGGDL